MLAKNFASDLCRKGPIRCLFEVWDTAETSALPRSWEPAEATVHRRPPKMKGFELEHGASRFQYCLLEVRLCL